MTRKSIVKFLSGVMAAASAWAAVPLDDSLLEFSPEEAARQEETKRAQRAKYDALSPTTIYGKVVDQDGEPVPDADVRIRWFKQTWLLGKADYGSTETLRTDKSGLFELTCPKLDRASAVVSKDGYEWLGGEMGRIVGWKKTTSKESPAVIVMRKQRKRTFMIVSPDARRLPGELIRVSGTDSASRAVDLMAWRLEDKWKESATPDADLKVDASFDTVARQWNVTYSTTNGSELVISDKLLYEAPASGYAPAVSASFATCHECAKYVYVKSRTPTIYSRVLFTHTANTDEHVGLTVYCKAWVNPYGDRTLEYDERADSLFGLANGLASEAKAALAQGRYPERPDMDKRIEEARENLKKWREAEAERDKKLRRRQELGLGAYDPDPDLDEEGKKKLLEERRKLLNIPERRGPRSWGYP